MSSIHPYKSYIAQITIYHFNILIRLFWLKLCWRLRWHIIQKKKMKKKY